MTLFIDSKRRRTPLWTLPLLLGATACSPYSFSSEIASMSNGVDKMAESFSSGYGGLANDLATASQVEMATKRQRVLPARACTDEVDALRSDTQVCALHMQGTPAPALTDVELQRTQTMDSVQVLKKYANALAAVTNAADRTAYDAAVGQLSGAVGTLTAAASPALPVGMIAPAAINAMGWVFGMALDQQRYDSLRTAVNRVGKPLPDQANPNPSSPIREVTGTLGEGLSLLTNARIKALRREVGLLLVRLNDRPSGDDIYRKQLAEAWSVAATIEALRRSDPRRAVADLAVAHDKLVEAVNDSGRSYASLLKAVGEFGEKISAVHAAMTAASSSSTASKKGS
jgi:hypothetical protein